LAEQAFVGIGVLLVAALAGELLPRLIARRFPETVAKGVAPIGLLIGRIFRRILSPAFAFTELLASPFGAGRLEEFDVSEEDIKAVVAEGKRSGAVEEGERQIINRVFRLGAKQAGGVMTPRAKVCALKTGDPFDHSVSVAIDSHRMWLPVVSGESEEVIGIISARDLLGLQRQNPSGNTGYVIMKSLTEPLCAPDTAPILTIIEQMRASRIHFAVVLDEFGVFVGVVTLHDVVEALIGEIGELEDRGSNIIKRADGSFLVDAKIAIDDLWEELSIGDVSPYSDSEFHSLGGFIMTYLGHVPEEGEVFAAHGYTFEVIDMDRHRIDKVLVTRVESTQADTSTGKATDTVTDKASEIKKGKLPPLSQVG
jgi:putative hemolysin